MIADSYSCVTVTFSRTHMVVMHLGLLTVLLLSVCVHALSCVCNCGSNARVLHQTLRPLRSPRIAAHGTSRTLRLPYLASSEEARSDAAVVEEANAKDADSSDAATAPSGISSAMISFIKAYKRELSPLLPPACRFYPTCSEYAMESIQDFGPQKGFILMVCRTLVSCFLHAHMM
jgi:putative membrane protein insertion efficiency factor